MIDKNIKDDFFKENERFFDEYKEKHLLFTRINTLYSDIEEYHYELNKYKRAIAKDEAELKELLEEWRKLNDK